MTDLGTIETSILALLQDATGITYSTAEVDEGLRRALSEYSQVQPYETVSTLTLTAAGREISLTSLTGITGVLEVWWPYFSTGETWPPNQVAGFRTWWNAGVLYLFLSSKEGDQPQIGDKVRVWWTKDQTINTFDSATATTLTTEGRSLVVLGAAGFAGLSGALDRAEVIDKEMLRKWGENMLADFRARLEKLRARAARTGGDPFGSGWSMDKWDPRQ